MATAADILANAHELVARAGGDAPGAESRPPAFKAVGISLAIASGVLIGSSFPLKKLGLLKANAKYNEEAGEGYGYLKNAWWWTGMTLMIVGEICNFAAYAFVDAILVTPLGALSVVIATILSAIFLKERLSFVGKVGCFNCIIGSVVIVLNAPEQSAVADIQAMKDFVVKPGFLTYTGVIVVGCIFIALWAGPRYGKKSMFVYLSICSLIGGLSVVCTQGLGSAIVAQAGGKPQFNQWFLYVLLVFVIVTLVTEIIYLNKALNLFNAALVTPTYYVFFTSATIVTSAILFQGFKGTPLSIATVIMGFLQICAGVVLLQMSKSAKDVPDAAVFKGDLDQIREIGEQEEPETEPKADAIRGAAALIRRISVSRQKLEEAEAKRYREEKMKDQLEPLGENEIVEWDGLRRRKTVVGDRLASPIVRRTTIHPPLGMSRFPDENEQNQAHEDGHLHGFFETVRSRASSVLRQHHPRQVTSDLGDGNGTLQTHPVALTDIKIDAAKGDTPIEPSGPGSLEEAQEHIYGLPPGLRKPGMNNQNGQKSPRSKPLPAQPTIQSPLGAPNIPMPSALGKSTRRQFSFQNIFRSPKSPALGDPQSTSTNLNAPPSRAGMGSRSTSTEQRRAMKTATEEERLGLVKGDSTPAALDPDRQSYYEHDSDPYSSPPRPLSEEYPYATAAQDSLASSPEAHTPLVPKHSYLLSSSTMPDTAPLYKEISFSVPNNYTSGHDSGHYAHSPLTSEEEEAGVDDDWQQIPSHHQEPHKQHQPPTPRFPPPNPSSTAASSTPPPIPPSHAPQQSQLPAYHSNNPYRPRPTPPRLREPAQVRAATAAASTPSPNTPTSRHPNTIGGTTTRDSADTSSHSHGRNPQSGLSTASTTTTLTSDREQAESMSLTRGEQTPSVRMVGQDQDQDLDRALAGIRVTSMEEREYDERWRRFAKQKSTPNQQQQQQQHDPSQSQSQGRGGAGAGAGGMGAFL